MWLAEENGAHHADTEVSAVSLQHG